MFAEEHDTKHIRVQDLHSSNKRTALEPTMDYWSERVPTALKCCPQGLGQAAQAKSCCQAVMIATLSCCLF